MPNENDPKFAEILKLASNDDDEAFKFVLLWSSYSHKFDDLVDGDTELTAANMVECNNILQRMLSGVFYQRHPEMLGLQLYLVGEAYAASEQFKDAAPDSNEREWANFLRHAGNDVIRAVAAITGGEVLLKEVSKKLRQYSINA